VTNPIIYDQNGNFFGVGYTGKTLTMSAGDVLVIDTQAGQKSVKLNGVSVFDKVKPQSTWLQLQAGENEFSINSDDADTDNMVFTMSFRQRYIG
ncbi:MAG: phage tail family protein, partial [Exiguobacterium sp.]|nr:phage tail family protein [Exiguobacterium sp.]